MVDRTVSVAVAPSAAAQAPRASIRQFARALSALPWEQLLVTLAFLVFAAVTLLISAAFGLSFVAPTESVSRAIGVHYAIPFAFGVAGYAGIQIFLGYLGLNQASSVPWRHAIMIDSWYLLLFVLVIYLHFHLKMWMPIINPQLHDAAYLAIDRDFSGPIGLLMAVRGFVASFVPAVDALYQAGFLAMFALSLWFHAAGHRRWHHHNMIALLLLEMAGAYSYLIAPAVGPFIFEQGPNAMASAAQHGMLAGFEQVRAQGAAWLAVHGGDYFTGPPAAMPSLHIAGAWIMTYYAIKARLVVAPVMALLLGWIAIESVVSRWHYLIDLPAGLALAAAVIVITNRLCRTRVTTITS